MKGFVFITGFSIALAMAGLASAAGPANPPVHRAFMHHAPSAVCGAGGRLLLHARYLQGAPAAAMYCGQLLSTDSVMDVHHWDRT